MFSINDIANLPEPLKKWVEESLDVDDLPEFSIRNRIEKPELEIDPLDLFVFPRYRNPFRLEWTRNLDGDIIDYDEVYDESYSFTSRQNDEAEDEDANEMAFILGFKTKASEDRNDEKNGNGQISTGNGNEQKIFEDEYMSCDNYSKECKLERNNKFMRYLNENNIDFLFEKTNNEDDVARNNISDDHVSAQIPSVDAHPISQTETDQNLTTDTDIETVDKLCDVKFIRKSASRIEEIRRSVLWKNQPVVDFETTVPEMAKTWPFELDDFQKQAIIYLEKGYDVFVTAHTSAGKTVVAEYAIALSNKNCSRSVYCSPIKALSNQKYRDFKQIFDNVGLVTGDVQINKEASCLIMTTEILKSMLYNGADLINNMEWLIFDEVHYINDPERGVVWEEVIIMIPSHVKLLLLSATVPNAVEFAEWIGQTRSKEVYIVATSYRPVPLKHYLLECSSGAMHLLMDDDKAFEMERYRQVAKSMENKKHAARPKPGSHFLLNHAHAIIRSLQKKNCLPSVFFIFSRSMCDQFATGTSSLDLTTKDEKHSIDKFFRSVIMKLNPCDREINQIEFLRDMTYRGLAIHHSGLLPILKEYVEILFCAGKIKVLFATETFAMGVNMPTRSVVFPSISKYDGKKRRLLHPGEYIQMSGRAGRRGLDDCGNVFILYDHFLPDSHTLITMLKGAPSILESRFRLTYSAILRLLQTKTFGVIDVMKRSFSEFASQKLALQGALQLELIESEIQALPKLDCEICSCDIEEYRDLTVRFLAIEKSLKKSLRSLFISSKYNNPGRVILFDYGVHLGIAAVLLERINVQASEVKVFTLIEPHWTKSLSEFDQNFLKTADFLPYPVPLSLPCIVNGDPKIMVISVHDITAYLKHTIDIDALKMVGNRKGMFMELRGSKQPPSAEPHVLLSRFIHDYHRSFVPINPLDDFKGLDFELAMTFKDRNKLYAALKQFSCLNCPDFVQHFQNCLVKHFYELKKQTFLYDMSEERLLLLPEYKKKLQLLETLGFLDSCGMVTQKGRAACLIQSKEVLVTEMLYRNMFSSMRAPVLAGLLSVLVFPSSRYSSNEPSFNAELDPVIKDFKQLVCEIDREMDSCGLKTECYANELSYSFVEIVYLWAENQQTFKEIIEEQNVHHGDVVRCIMLICDLCTQIMKASIYLCAGDVQNKMQEVIKSIRRDIVLTPSLYLE